jgi:hypothetical protein
MVTFTVPAVVVSWMETVIHGLVPDGVTEGGVTGEVKSNVTTAALAMPVRAAAANAVARTIAPTRIDLGPKLLSGEVFDAPEYP